MLSVGGTNIRIIVCGFYAGGTIVLLTWVANLTHCQKQSLTLFSWNLSNLLRWDIRRAVVLRRESR